MRLKKEILKREYNIRSLESVLYVINTKLHNIVELIKVENNKDVKKENIKAFIKALGIIQHDIKLTCRYIDREFNVNSDYLLLPVNNDIRLTLMDRQISLKIYMDTFNSLKNVNKAILTAYKKDFNFINNKNEEEGVLNIDYDSISLVYKNIEIMHEQIWNARDMMS